MPPESRVSQERALLVAGMPATGKTSYLALFYLAISTGRTRALSLGSFADDREYLNEIAGRLSSCQEAVHTEVEEHRELALSLNVNGTPGVTYLRIPDLSGETWEQALHDRRWEIALDERIRPAIGVLLFMHVTEFDVGASIFAGNLAEEALAGGISEPDAQTKQGLGSGVSLDRADRTPSQVALVDLLQLLLEQRAGRPARASIVLSAWDLVEHEATPDAWLMNNSPLAYQYLESNKPWLESRIWGVSAQGGSFRAEGERKKLVELDAVDRATVIAGPGDPAAVEAPVLWSLGLDC